MSETSARQELVSHVDFQRLKQYIVKSTGLHYFTDKEADLAERVSRRLASLRISDCGAYLNQLAGPRGKHELELLAAELTIGETYFFRHTEQFDALREQIIPDIIARNQNSRSLRIWSAGCSYGAEPYSVSILLKTHFAEQLQGWDVSILATDINTEFLAMAREGAYDEWAFRGTPADLKLRCFTQVGKKWMLASEFKKDVSFVAHNLISDPFPPCESFQSGGLSFDLILCRNVVIYFSQADFSQIVGRFENCLTDGGWLLVGHAEPNLEMFDAFCLVSVPGAILYQRNSSPKLTVIEPAPLAFEEWAAPILNDTPPSIWPELLPVPLPLPTPVVSAPAPVSEFDNVRKLADQGQWEQADVGCQNLLRLDNHNSRVHCFHALILEHLGRSADSEQALRRAIYLDRNSVLAHYYLGVRQQLNRDYGQAARSFGNVELLLAKLDSAHVFGDADGMTAGEMRQTVRMQLEAVKACERRSTGRP